MTTQTAELMQAAVERFNGADLAGFAQLLERDMVMYPDPSWPEPGPYVGRDAAMGFVADWIVPWERVQLQVDEQVERDDGWVVSRCRWLATGKASGAPTEVPFTFVTEVREGRIATLKAFFDHAEALRALG